MKKVKKSVRRITQAGIGLGIGTAVVGSISGGGVVTPVFRTAAGMMSPLVTAGMAGHTIRLMKQMKPRRRKKKKRMAY